jgi:starch synthase (maltosyl-transferring)
METRKHSLRVVIEAVKPEIDSGRFPVKRISGDEVTVEADIFTDGHDLLSAVLLHRREGDGRWEEAPMEPLANDRWRGVFSVAAPGRYRYTLQAWVDRFRTWRRDLEKKIAAGQQVGVELQVGAGLIEEAASRASGSDAESLEGYGKVLKSSAPQAEKIHQALHPELALLMAEYAQRRFLQAYPRELEVVVDRKKARFSTWYEMFPRSCTKVPGGHGTFKDCEDRLPEISRMGFDVLYLPPIHPIGRTHRKGSNNQPAALPGDPGSPWAIGAREGGGTRRSIPGWEPWRISGGF